MAKDLSKVLVFTQQATLQGPQDPPKRQLTAPEIRALRARQRGATPVTPAPATPAPTPQTPPAPATPVQGAPSGGQGAMQQPPLPRLGRSRERYDFNRKGNTTIGGWLMLEPGTLMDSGTPQLQKEIQAIQEDFRSFLDGKPWNIEKNQRFGQTVERLDALPATQGDGVRRLHDRNLGFGHLTHRPDVNGDIGLDYIRLVGGFGAQRDETITNRVEKPNPFTFSDLYHNYREVFPLLGQAGTTSGLYERSSKRTTGFFGVGEARIKLSKALTSARHNLTFGAYLNRLTTSEEYEKDAFSLGFDYYQNSTRPSGTPMSTESVRRSSSTTNSGYGLYGELRGLGLAPKVGLSIQAGWRQNKYRTSYDENGYTRKLDGDPGIFGLPHLDPSRPGAPAAPVTPESGSEFGFTLRPGLHSDRKLLELNVGWDSENRSRTFGVKAYGETGGNNSRMFYDASLDGIWGDEARARGSRNGGGFGAGDVGMLINYMDPRRIIVGHTLRALSAPDQTAEIGFGFSTMHRPGGADPGMSATARYMFDRSYLQTAHVPDVTRQALEQGLTHDFYSRNVGVFVRGFLGGERHQGEQEGRKYEGLTHAGVEWAWSGSRLGVNGGLVHQWKGFVEEGNNKPIALTGVTVNVQWTPNNHWQFGAGLSGLFGAGSGAVTPVLSARYSW